jgi:glycosyltransferase involved in cell wall biosynthesis
MPSAKKRIQLAVTVGDIGGVQTFLAGFASFLKDQGHEVEVLIGEGAWLGDELGRRGIPVKRLHLFRREISPWLEPLALVELWRAIRRFKPDAIHLNSSKMGFLGSLAARFARVPNVVYRIGGWVFLENLSPAKKNLYRRIEKISAPWKDTIICVHPGDVEVANREGILPRKHLLAVPNGIDLPLFDQALLPRDEARRLLGLPQDAFLFGTIAGFYPPKEIPAYLDACAIVAKKYPTAAFFIIGDGPLRQAIETKRRDVGLEARFHLLGNRDQAFRFLRAADVFALPSSKEGMPWALLEAMAAELPCLVTQVGAMPWMLGEAGWTVPPLDQAALVAAMNDLFTHPDERKRRAALARREVETRFPLARTYGDNASALLR